MAKSSSELAHLQSTLTIDEAVRQLLPGFERPYGACQYLEQALLDQRARLWNRDRGARQWNETDPIFIKQQLVIGVHQRPDGWHAELKMQAGKIGIRDFHKVEWAVSAEEIEVLRKRLLGKSLVGKKSAAGSKGRDDWEAIIIEVACFLWEHGTATADTKIWEHVESWLRDPPSRTQLKTHIVPLLRRLREIDRK